MSKGIVDPWRIVPPIKKEEPKKTPTQQKRQLGDENPDDDLKQHKPYELRGARGSLKISHEYKDAPLDAILNALDEIIGSLEEGPRMVRKAHIGFKLYEREFNVPEGQKAATWNSRHGHVFFIEQDHDQGLLQIINLFLTMNYKKPGFLQKHKIEVIQR